MNMKQLENIRLQPTFIPDSMDVSMQLVVENTADTHKHENYEIVYVCSGELGQIVNGKKLMMGLGECIILSTEDFHSYAEFPNTNTLNRDIMVEPTLFNSLVNLVTKSEEETKRFLSRRLTPVQFSLTELNDLEALAQQISSTTEVYKKRCLAIELVLRIISKFFEAQEKQELPSQTSLVARIFDSLNKDHTIKGGIPRLCTWLKYSRSYICHTFKKETGLTLSEYITDVRLKRIAYYLKTTNYSLREIADLVGIESLSYMNKIFKKKYALTPAKYRKKHTNTPSRTEP